MAFQLCRKNNFIRKIRLVPKFLMQQSGQQTITRHILPNILQTKGSQIMKFVHLVDYNSGVKRGLFIDLLQIFQMKFLMSKVTFETYFIENTRLQGWGCLEHAIRMSQRQISEDLGMQDWSACRMQIYIENYLPYTVSAYFILGERYIFLKSFEGFAVKVLCQKVVLMIQNVG